MASKIASAFYKKSTELNPGLQNPSNTQTQPMDSFVFADPPTALTHSFSRTQLASYSRLLNFIVYTGIIIHLTILIILVFQQLTNQLLFRRWKRQSRNPLLINHSTIAKNNYVTFAFVFHQVVIDLIRLTYSYFYANSMEIESKSPYDSLTREEPAIDASAGSIHMEILYKKHCVRMALGYSVLNMVTIINILSILISETCRFYDLKLSSTDTSNYCCILFGIILIWISSLIIISSLMLVGVADSAAPTWHCNLYESESTTRFLVINIVWFMVIMFIVIISFFYSCSLYKELSSLDYSHHRLSIFTANHFTMSAKPNASFLNRHLRIVGETSKRLVFFISLIVIFCLTFIPNFVMTMLKNVLDSNVSLEPFNLIFSIWNQTNPTLNSINLLTLCILSRDSALNRDLTNLANEVESPTQQNDIKKRLQNLRERLDKRLSKSSGNDSGSCAINESLGKHVTCTNVYDKVQKAIVVVVNEAKGLNSDDDAETNNYNSNIQEFYSKVGSRLGRNS